MTTREERIKYTKESKKIDAHANVFEAGGLAYRDCRHPISLPALSEKYNEVGTAAGIVSAQLRSEGGHLMQANEDVLRIINNMEGFSWLCEVDPRMAYNAPSTDFSHFFNYYKQMGARGVGFVRANIQAASALTKNFLSHAAKCHMSVALEIGVDTQTGLTDTPALTALSSLVSEIEGLHILVYLTEKTRDILLPALTALMEINDSVYLDAASFSGITPDSRTADYINRYYPSIIYGENMMADEDEPFVAKKLNALYIDGLINKKAYDKICFENVEKLFPRLI